MHFVVLKHCAARIPLSLGRVFIQTWTVPICPTFHIPSHSPGEGHGVPTDFHTRAEKK